LAPHVLGELSQLRTMFEGWQVHTFSRVDRSSARLAQPFDILIKIPTCVDVKRLWALPPAVGLDPSVACTCGTQPAGQPNPVRVHGEDAGKVRLPNILADNVEQRAVMPIECVASVRAACLVSDDGHSLAHIQRQ
jgi:hypothetical protein